MDDLRFDRLVKTVATRRSALGLLAGLTGLGIEHVGATRRRAKARPRAKPLKCVANNACAQWCASVFGANTAAASRCTSDANKCQGPCTQCGPGCIGTCSRNLCGTTCVATGTDTANCGGCGTACPGDTCKTPTCAGGTCGTAPANEGQPCDGGSGTCRAGTCQANTPNVCSGRNSPNPCFERSADTCGGTCKCGTDLGGNLTCYANAYCLGPNEPDCTSNADCEAIFGAGSVCFSGASCCAKNGCTTPCPTPS